MAISPAHWESRRALTDNPKTAPQTYRSAARALMEMDQLCEAAVMFGLAGDSDGLTEIVDKAVEEGNFFLFQTAALKFKGEKPDKSRLQALIDSAEKTGQTLYAETAKKYLENL